MRRLLHRRPSPATIIALIALVVAMGGTGYAAVTLPANSVGAKQIKKRAVTRQKIKKNSVTSSKVKDFSLLAKDFKSGQLPAGPRGLQGPKGDKGEKGDKGDKGDTGAVGPTQGFAAPKLSGGVPSATPDSPAGFIKQDVTTVASGRLFVFGRGQLSVNCTTATQVKVGLYVDGAPAAGSGQPISSGPTSTEVHIWGITDTLPAGDHTLEIKWDCVGADTAGGSSFGGDGALGGILVGS